HNDGKADKVNYYFKEFNEQVKFGRPKDLTELHGKGIGCTQLLGIAYSKSVRKEIALNGFKFEGVSPCDRHKCDYDFYTPTLATKDSLRTPPFDISSQEQLSMVAVEKSREMYEEERKTLIDQIKLQLNILSLFPIINKVQNFGER
ncbi:jerky, partial [Schistosoma japonicum]